MTVVLPFTLHGKDFGFRANDVREVVKLDSVTRVPLAQGGMIGLTMLRGNVITLFDLTGALDLPKQTNDGKMAIIVRCDDELYGFPVDTIAGLRLPGDERPLTVIDIPGLIERMTA